ncbi:MAG: YggS family pyridoxal phosphate enzyme, partial [Burkholderiales bacterium]|nr:YggS family pyridoxal phosphate enzyme [Burkholderiales bacterium]
SMGMSDDLESAIAEGATLVRIGRAIFGERTGNAAPDTRV